MDPILFKQQLEPLSTHEEYDVQKILNICYPLRGCWEWSMIDKLNDSLLRIFKMVHLNQSKYLVIEPEWITDIYIDIGNKEFEYDERWGICTKYSASKESHVYKLLEELLVESSESNKTPEWDEYGTSSSESSTEVTVDLTESSIKEIEFSIIERDQRWKDKNPAYNPRLIKDLEKGYIQPPVGFTVETTKNIIKGILTLGDDQFLAADGSGDISNNGIQEFGIYGKEHCLKSVKMIRWLKNIDSEYNLEIDTSHWIEKVEKRTNPWKWIRVGPGFYRDFDWVLLGDEDCIWKTIQVLKEMGHKPPLGEYKKVSGYTFDFDPEILFKLSCGKCFDVDTGKTVICKNPDPYNFVVADESKIEQIRGYIFDHFVNQYPDRWIPGKKNKWAQEFFKLIKKLKKGKYIDFSTLNQIKYTAATNATHYFSQYGFAISKSEKNFKIKDIERAIKEYKYIK